MGARAAKGGFEITGAHVAWAMALFFGSVIAVNVVFTVLAVRSFPGEDVRRSYLQGLQYNDTLAERRIQAALGWRAVVEQGVDATGAPQLLVRVAGADGEAISGLALTAELRRPVDARLDQQLAFAPAGAGVYAAPLPTDLAAGLWDLRAEAVRGSQRFAFERELVWRR